MHASLTNIDLDNRKAFINFGRRCNTQSVSKVFDYPCQKHVNGQTPYHTFESVYMCK